MNQFALDFFHPLRSTIWENKFIKSKYTYAPRPGGEKIKSFSTADPRAHNDDNGEMARNGTG